MAGSRTIAAALALAVLAGCDPPPEPVPYVDVDIDSPDKPVTDGPNAFDAYADLAGRAERRATFSLDARDTPATRRKTLEQLMPLLLELEAASKHDCAFRFELVGPFEERPHHIGWLHLSRALVWLVEASVEKSDWPEAVRWTVVATAFGLDLGGGAVSDAALGYGAVDGARRALAPFLQALDAESLTQLAHGLDRALEKAPEPATTIENEGRLMLLAIKQIQDAHRQGKLDDYVSKFYGESKDAVKSLKDMPDIERSLFFQSLFDEQKLIVARLLQAAATPGAKRSGIENRLDGRAKTISEQFFSTGLPWLSVRDLTLTRTRLFALAAHINLHRAEHGEVPKDLSTFENTTDPYTGLSFGYLALGRDYLLYSYGLDGKDDRGDSDTKQREPDVLLEGS